MTLDTTQPPTPVSAALRQIMTKYSLARLRTLDVGCGAGVQLREFRDGVGVDANLSNVEMCRNLGMQVVQHDVNDGLPFEAHRFDVVLASHVLEHLKSPASFCEEAMRVLVPGGRLIVGVPLERSLFRLLTHDPYYAHSGHIYAFSPEGLATLMQYAGFRPSDRVFDIPLARRTGSTLMQVAGNRWPPQLLEAVCSNVWVVGVSPTRLDKADCAPDQRPRHLRLPWEI